MLIGKHCQSVRYDGVIRPSWRRRTRRYATSVPAVSWQLPRRWWTSLNKDTSNRLSSLTQLGRRCSIIPRWRHDLVFHSTALSMIAVSQCSACLSHIWCWLMIAMSSTANHSQWSWLRASSREWKVKKRNSANSRHIRHSYRCNLMIYCFCLILQHLYGLGLPKEITFHEWNQHGYV